MRPPPYARSGLRCAAVLWFALVGITVAAASLPLPSRDDEVVEVLPAITRTRPVPVAAAVTAKPAVHDPRVAASVAREAISTARRTGDARYWGRAETALEPWWNKADAPVEIMMLQATVQQGLHAFTDAHAVLSAALRRAPNHAQILLTLASLERLAARYPQALMACDAVGRAGQALYAQACRWETVSMQGQHDVARTGLAALVVQAGSVEQRGWILSLQAEAEERAGRDAAAQRAYKASLAIDRDLYTAIAYGDLLLRTGDAAGARAALEGLPETDAVLLRRAAALRRLNDSQWRALRDELRARESALDRRGDDLTLHDRERALLALWLDDAPVRALDQALRNLTLQREPLDWWIAMQSARAAGDTAAFAKLAGMLRDAGLKDLRLQKLAPLQQPPQLQSAAR